MPYIGNTAADRFVASKAASVFSGDGSTTAFTLDHSVGSDEDILVSVDGVIQEPSVAYSVSGTTLTFTAAPSTNSGNNIFVYYLFRTVGTVSHTSSNALEATSGTFTGDVTIPDKIIHDGDTNTAIRFPSADTISFETGGSERARVDSNGVLYIATTDDDPVFNNANGASIGSNNGSALAGVGQFSCNGGVAIRANRSNETGATIAIHTGGTQKGTLGTQSSNDIYIGCDRGAGLRITDQELAPSNASGSLRDDAVDLGHPSGRFDDVRATNGTIQTSDRNEKQDIEELSDAEQRVAVVAKGLMRKFRWKSAVTKKGDNARTHFGIIAQDLQDAFTAEGLDAGNYAMFISDTWTDDNGNEQTRLGVRYSELLAFIISAL